METNEKYMLEMQVAILKDRINQLQYDRFLHSEIYHKVERIIGYYKKTSCYAEHFSKTDWKLIFNYWWPGYSFLSQLSDQYPNLSEREILLCCLLKLRFSIIDISILLECTRDSIYKRSVAIRKKMTDIPEEYSLRQVLEKM